jgi:hypothetical protein
MAGTRKRNPKPKPARASVRNGRDIELEIDRELRQKNWLEDEILRIALEVGGGPDRRVSLSDLRQAIPEAGRSEIDDALRAMSRVGRIALFPNDDRWSITARDQRDAVELSGVPQHVIYVPSRG